MVTTTRSNAKSRSHHDVAHLQPLINVPTKYQLPTPYSLGDSPDKILKVKVTTAKSKVKSRPHHNIAHLKPPPTPPPPNTPTKYQLPTPMVPEI